MNTFKYWYFFSLLLLIYYLDLLDDESNHIDFQVDNDEYIKNYELDLPLFNVSFCFSIKDFEKDLNLNDTIIFLPDYLKVISEYLNTKFDLSIDLKGSYFFNNYVCFLINTQDRLKSNEFTNLNYKIFGYSSELKTPFHQAAFSHENGNENITWLIIEKIELDYKSSKFFECEENLFLRKGIKYSFNSCFNDCLRNLSNKSLYLYEIEIESYVNLKDQTRNLTEELYCNRTCNQKSCRFEFYVSSIFERDDGNLSVPKISTQIAYYKAIFSIDGLEYWNQFIGLITLFINISYIKTIPSLIKMALKLIFKFFKIKSIYFGKLFLRFKIIIFISSVIISIFLTYKIINENLDSKINPIQSRYFIFNPNYSRLDIILCIPIQSLIRNRFNLSESDEQNILNNFNFEKIENQTNNKMYMSFNGIYVTYGFKENDLIKKNGNWKIKDDVLFKNNSYYYDFSPSKSINLLDRCWRIEFYLEETSYESLLLTCKIIVSIKPNALSSLFIVEKDEYFLSKSHKINKTKGISKYKRCKISSSLGTNCKDYSNSDCYSNVHCSENCKIKKFYNQYSSLTTEVVINKDELINKLKIRNFNQLFFNNTIDSEMRDKCKFINNCCDEKFQIHHRYGYIDPNNYEINLHHFNMFALEDNINFWITTFKLINIIQFMYGVSVYGIFICIRQYFKSKYFKNLFVILICGIGFLYHILIIFNDIINGKFISIGYFLTTDRLLYPDICICIEMKNSIDEHHRLTGYYLENLERIDKTNFFDKIVYLNNEGNFSEYKLIDKNKNDDIKFSSFYFLESFKCFQIEFNLSYTEIDTYAIDDNYLVKIYLNKLNLPDFVYLMVKKRHTKEFNSLHKIHSGSFTNYKIKLDTFVMTIQDKFKLIRHPFSWFYEMLFVGEAKSTTAYFDRMVQNFKLRYNLTTTLISLDEDNFNLEINNLLFNQYYKQYQNQTDQFVFPDFFSERTIIDQNLFSASRSVINETLADFEINCPFLTYNTDITNESNYIKLLQNLLNSINLWLTVNVLDLYICINKIINLIDWLYKILLKFKFSIRFNLTM